MAILLHFSLNRSLELTLPPEIFNSRIVERKSGAFSVEVLKNEISETLRQGMRCTVEWPGKTMQEMVVDGIGTGEAWLRLTLKKPGGIQ